MVHSGLRQSQRVGRRWLSPKPSSLTNPYLSSLDFLLYYTISVCRKISLTLPTLDGVVGRVGSKWVPCDVKQRGEQPAEDLILTRVDLALYHHCSVTMSSSGTPVSSRLRYYEEYARRSSLPWLKCRSVSWRRWLQAFRVRVAVHFLTLLLTKS